VLSGKDIDTVRRFVVHAVHLSPQRSFREKEEERYFNVRAHKEEAMNFPVSGTQCISYMHLAIGACP